MGAVTQTPLTPAVAGPPTRRERAVAYTAGAVAARGGKPLTDNPYDQTESGKDLRYHWTLGYLGNTRQ